MKYVNEIANRTIVKMSNLSSSLSSSNSFLNKKSKREENHQNKSPVLVSNPIHEPKLDKMQIGSIDSTGRYIPFLKHNPEDVDNVDNKSALSANSGDNLNNVWNFGNELSILDSNFDVKSIGSQRSRLRKKFNRFLDILPLNKDKRDRSSSSNNEFGFSDDIDDKEMAERIAAMIVNDVMKANNMNQ